MGQDETKIQMKDGWHQKFGKIQFFNSTTEPKEIHIIANLNYETLTDQHFKWQKILKELQSNSKMSEHLILPLRIQSERCLLCTNSNQKYNIKLQYRKFKNTLHQDIKNRRQINNYYLQHHLWYFMYILLKVAAHFEQESSYLGNIHTNNVYVDQNGKVCIFTIFSSPQETQNIQRIKASKYQDAFIAPEQIEKIVDQQQQNQLNHNKIDLFNIGLVLLSAILLKDCYFLYNRTTFSINFEKLQAYKSQLINGSQKYKKTLRNFIFNFLILDPSIRKTPIFYYNHLKEYQKQIIGLQEFNNDNLLTDEKSPQVINYIQNCSPNSKQTKYLSLSKNWSSNKKQSKKLKDTNESVQKQIDYRPLKVERKLFQEFTNLE